MIRKRTAGALFGMVLALGALASTPASAATSDSPGSGVTTIYGGTTQSTDPTGWNYVPAPSGGVTPLSATGYASIGGFSYSFGGVTVTVPASILTHSITGSGLSVTNNEVKWGPSVGSLTGQLCNYRFQFQNRYGSTIYSTTQSALHAGCDYTNPVTNPKITWSYGIDHTERVGLNCARLYVNAVFRGEQCHNIG